MDKFYIFGLQRSGTTFLEHIVSLNFNMRVANTENSWKHSIVVPENLEDYCKFWIVKNPYTWLESIVFRDPADLLVTATSFNLQDRSNSAYIVGHDQVNLKNLCLLYNIYIKNWSNTDVIKVRYEDLLNKETLDKFFKKNNFINEYKHWKIPVAGSLFMSEGFSKDSYSYYLSQRPQLFNKTDIDVINTYVNFDLLHQFDYTRV
jgi:hypothetical protein